jgi:murein tripeptide amidase MpaA
MRLAAGALLLVVILCPAMILGEELPIVPETLLPPVIEWHGASESLVAGPRDPWQTPAEASHFAHTPTYAETMVWLARLADTTPRLQLVPLAESWEGRTIWLVAASAEGASDPATISASGKPVLFAQAGIHSGEIDGKDAGLMLLRDLTVGPLSNLLDRVSVLFIPILNVDGHERVSPFSRVNQRGPSEMGWRTNARNLNLNRDFAKLDTPEIRAVVEVLDRWHPDLYLDLHVTDGVEKQYDVTWGFNGRHAHSPAIARWLEDQLDPALSSGLAAMGHIPGPHVFVFDRADLEKGVWFWEGGPRYSDGYGSTRHVATVLVENHSLKPYKQRVLGTRVLLEVAIRLLAESGSTLREATAVDRARRWRELSLGFSRNQTPDPEPFEFLAVEHQLEPSSISGDLRIQWTGRPITVAVPAYRTTHPLATVVPATAYWVPAAWPQVIERLAAHGIDLEVLEQPRSVEVEVYRLGSPTYGDEPFEGRLRVEAEATPETMTRIYARGSVRVPTDQPLGVLATLLLEPESPDSFFQWGFFSEVFQRTEYAEAYVLEPLAEQMLAADPALQSEFAAHLASDEEFAASPRQRLQWFYERSPLLDSNWRLYPVGREMP